MGYNDLIFNGLLQAEESTTDMVMQYYSVSTDEEVCSVLDQWFAETTSDPSLLVMASSEYRIIMQAYRDRLATMPANKQVLQFEGSIADNLNLVTFQVSMYGASYLAGVAAREMLADTTVSGITLKKNAMVMLGTSIDPTILPAADGFSDGYRKVGWDGSVDTHCLSADYSGYANALLGYQKMYEWSQRYSFFYPVAGGSNNGVFRYLREYPDKGYTCGMDVDQSGLCNAIIGSMVKHVDRLLNYYITTWMHTGALPPSATYDLSSGYVDFLPIAGFPFASAVEAARPAAIAAEQEYLTTR